MHTNLHKWIALEIGIQTRIIAGYAVQRVVSAVLKLHDNGIIKGIIACFMARNGSQQHNAPENCELVYHKPFLFSILEREYGINIAAENFSACRRQ